MRGEVRRKSEIRVETRTYKLISNELSPFSCFSFGSNHRSVSFEYLL